MSKHLEPWMKLKQLLPCVCDLLLILMYFHAETLLTLSFSKLPSDQSRDTREEGRRQTQTINTPANKELHQFINRSIAAADGGGDQINPSINQSINQSRGDVHSAACICKPAYSRSPFQFFTVFCDKLIYKSTNIPCSHCQCHYSKLKP